MSKKLKFDKRTDIVEELMRQAWLLTDDEINSISPGNLGKVGEIINFDYENHPFSNLDKNNLDVDILKIMRNPSYFFYTCKTLFNKEDGNRLEIAPFQNVILKELWTRQFPMLIGSRGLGKSFTLALYILLRLIFTPGAKVVIVASAFRQAKVVFEYMEKIWYNSPILRDLVSGKRGLRGRECGPRRDIDRCEFVLGESVAIALPLGDGKKIRGLRANYIISEEYASIPEEIYATVVQGFASVTADPIGNMKDYAKLKVRRILGIQTDEMDIEEAKKVRGNQSILSGTAYYSFNHFCKYWKEYKAIIETKGDKEKLTELLKGEIPKDWNWKDYSIIRIPYKLIPEGYMDAKTIARARQITHKSSYLMEYEAVFANDSEGFFPRSLVLKCSLDASNPRPPKFKSCSGVPVFTAALEGRHDRTYIYGIDPASENDRFSIVIIEVWPDHRRVVYSWTTKKKEHSLKLKKGMAEEHDFYRYCCRKIRDLMKVFPAERIMVDKGGGGIAVREAFSDPDKLQEGELPIYEVIEEGKEKQTDDMQGSHILEMVHFSPAWTSEANHGLKKDMEEQVLVFPAMDSLALGLAAEVDKSEGRVSEDVNGERVYETYDTLESCILEIEELKDEIATIVLTKTANGTENWDTPDRKNEAAKQKSGRMRKDRYSSLLMANMGARQLSRAIFIPNPQASMGGFAHRIVEPGPKNKKTGALYTGPNWFVTAMSELNDGYGTTISRK